MLLLSTWTHAGVTMWITQKWRGVLPVCVRVMPVLEYSTHTFYYVAPCTE